MALALLHFSQSVFEKERHQADDQLMPMLCKTDDIFEKLQITGAAQEWLKKQQWKRTIAYLLFADLLTKRELTKRILEIGGGLSCTTLALAQNNNYALIERATHETPQHYRRLEEFLGKPFVTIADWIECESRVIQDIIIANDVFPNVDQRLYEFVEKYLPLTNELRLSITYYENTAYEVERLSSHERLIMKPWGLREVSHFLKYLTEKYPQFCNHYPESELVYEDYCGTLFSNSRNIIYLRISRDE